MTKRQLEKLAAKIEPKLRNRFRSVMQRTKAKWSVAQIEAALQGGTISTLIDDIEKAAGMFAAQTAAVTALVGGEVASQLSSKLDKLVSYDATNPRAVDALRRNRLRLVQGLRDDQRNAIADILGDYSRSNPRQQAVAIRDVLGLGAAQERWIASYRKRLETLDRGALGLALRDARFDDTVTAAIDSGKALTAKQVDKMVERYAARALKYRSEVVARTESIRALQEGMEEGYQQAVDAGTLDQACMVCSWHAGSGPPTRDWHAFMKGQKRPWGVPFTSGLGNALKHPCDPDAPAEECVQCRCARSVKVHATPEAAAAALRAAGYAGPLHLSTAPPPQPPAAPAPPAPKPKPAPVVTPPPPIVPSIPTPAPTSTAPPAGSPPLTLTTSVHADAALTEIAAGKWERARLSIQTELEADGLVLVDMEPGATRYGKVSIRRNLNANGTHSRKDNLITLRTDIADDAAAFAKAHRADPTELAQGMADAAAELDTLAARKALNGVHKYRTFVHEVHHVYSPMTWGAYRGEGVFVEEITTEWAARGYLTRNFGVPRSAWKLDHFAKIGGYRGWTARTAEMVARAQGLSFEEAAEVVEEASRKFKRLPKGSLYDGREMLHAFADLLPGDQATRTKYVDEMRAIAQTYN